MEGKLLSWSRKADLIWILDPLAYGFCDRRALVEHQRRVLYITPFAL